MGKRYTEYNLYIRKNKEGTVNVGFVGGPPLATYTYREEAEEALSNLIDFYWEHAEADFVDFVQNNLR